MADRGLRLARFHRVGGAVHGVALSGDAEHLLVGSERGLRLMDRSGAVKFRLGRNGRAFNAVALAPGLDAGLAMERAGRLFRLDFEHTATEEHGDGEHMQVAAAGIWEQRDDLYSLDFAPHVGDKGSNKRSGLIALGHHALGLTALDGRGQLLWRLGPREGLAPWGRTWHATISPDGRTIYTASLGGSAHGKRGEVMVVDAAVGKPIRSAAVSGRVTLLASLPSPLGVAAVVRGADPRGADPAGECCAILAYDAGLYNRAWFLSCPPDVAVTAVASAPGQAALVVGTNTGELWRVGAFTGRILAQYDLLFASTVLSVAVAETGEIAAGLANGQVAFLERVRDGG